MRVSFWSMATVGVLAGFVTDTPRAQSLSSYPVAAIDTAGSTGASSVALGRPDYRFVNDAGLGFGGNNTDVFAPGESTIFHFLNPLKNIPGQPDLKVSAFVGGLGATDNAQVQVETSSGGANYHVVAVFDTADGRVTYPFNFERDFESVKHFEVDFAAQDDVTHVRLTNLAGTIEGLRLDALEGLHPSIPSDHAFEIRFERYRGSNVERFLVRIKNLARLGGAGIHEFRIDTPPVSTVRLESTYRSMFSVNGELLCVQHCIPDNGPLIPFSRHAWSVDGITQAPSTVGLAPGRQASHTRWHNFDLDTVGSTFLAGFSFLVTFTDGVTHTFTYDNDVVPLNEEGMEYQKYQYFSPTPAISQPHRVHYYQFSDAGPIATHQTYGTGCLGLNHDVDARPLTGTTIQLTTDSMPVGAGFGATILSLTQINPGTNLTSQGLTGCFQYLTIDAVATWVPAGGVGSTPFTIPNDPGLAGLLVMTQGATFSPGVNPVGALTSNGVMLTVGNY